MKLLKTITKAFANAISTEFAKTLLKVLFPGGIGLYLLYYFRDEIIPRILEWLTIKLLPLPTYLELYHILIILLVVLAISYLSYKYGKRVKHNHKFFNYKNYRWKYWLSVLPPIEIEIDEKIYCVKDRIPYTNNPNLHSEYYCSVCGHSFHYFQDNIPALIEEVKSVLSKKYNL